MTRGVDVGDKVEDFELPDESGTVRRLSELLDDGPVVLFFYPAALSPGCTAEACHFRDHGGNSTGLSDDAADTRVATQTQPAVTRFESDPDDGARREESAKPAAGDHDEFDPVAMLRAMRNQPKMTSVPEGTSRELPLSAPGLDGFRLRISEAEAPWIGRASGRPPVLTHLELVDATGVPVADREAVSRFTVSRTDPGLADSGGAPFQVTDIRTGIRYYFSEDGTLVFTDRRLAAGLGSLRLDAGVVDGGPRLIGAGGRPAAGWRVEPLGGERFAVLPPKPSAKRPHVRLVVDAGSGRVVGETIGVRGWWGSRRFGLGCRSSEGASLG